jgi:dimethylglycine dehydrogenase
MAPGRVSTGPSMGFVAYEKSADFIGKQATQSERASGGRLRLRCFVVDTDNVDAIGDEPIWYGDAVRGWATSGGFAHASGVSVVMGYVPKEIADEPGPWSIEILGTRYPARLQVRALFDPDGQRLVG